MNKDPFKILGIKRTEYNEKILKNAYLRQVRAFPPERFPKKFREIRQAYEAIKESKSPYDRLSLAPLPLSTTDESVEEVIKYIEKIFEQSVEEEFDFNRLKISLKKKLLLKALEQCQTS